MGAETVLRLADKDDSSVTLEVSQDRDFVRFEVKDHVVDLTQAQLGSLWHFLHPNGRSH